MVFESNIWRIYVYFKRIPSARNRLVKNRLGTIRFSKCQVNCERVSYCAHLDDLAAKFDYICRIPFKEEARHQGNGTLMHFSGFIVGICDYSKQTLSGFIIAMCKENQW
jgi:hypothetical protein